MIWRYPQQTLMIYKVKSITVRRAAQSFSVTSQGPFTILSLTGVGGKVIDVSIHNADGRGVASFKITVDGVVITSDGVDNFVEGIGHTIGYPSETSDYTSNSYLRLWVEDSIQIEGKYERGQYAMLGVTVSILEVQT